MADALGVMEFIFFSVGKVQGSRVGEVRSLHNIFYSLKN
jgi:hypothetical protein